jgi:serine/threonine protein phosphatase 1
MIWGKSFVARRSGSAAPRGHRAYAVGDIHGRLDLLEELLARIEADNCARGKARTTIIFLGDLVDRGPESAQVVERLRLYHPPFAKTVFIMGNHEEVLLRILGGESDLIKDWLKFGGAQCASSYGIDPDRLRRMRGSEGIELLKRRIPGEQRKFLSSFVDTASFGNYLFVHAGVRPGVPLANQVAQDLRWIRMPFLSDDSDHGRIVVHGHTISEEVEVRANRIGVDTGAYRSGVLSAVGLQGDERWLIQTGTPGADRPEAAPVASLSEAY